MNLNDIIKAAATRMTGAKVEVELDRSRGTVSISAPGQEAIFMQGDEGDQFISEVGRLYEEAGHVTEDEAALCHAEQYADCIWG